MPDEIVGRFSIGTEPDEYESLWDDKWAKELDEVVGTAAVLRQHVFDLLLSWKAANHAHGAPFVLLSSVHQQSDPDEIDSLAMRVCARVEQAVSRLPLPRQYLQQVQLTLIEVAGSIKHIERKAMIPRAKLWKSYFENHSFQMHVWGTQRLAYGALWDGYSSFVNAVRKTAAPKAKTREEKTEAFKEKFGDDFYADCFDARPVAVGRAVRNALSHALGALTEDFKKLTEDERKQFSVVDNKINIWPTNTRALHDALKPRIFALAEKAVTRTEFK